MEQQWPTETMTTSLCLSTFIVVQALTLRYDLIRHDIIVRNPTLGIHFIPPSVDTLSSPRHHLQKHTCLGVSWMAICGLYAMDKKSTLEWFKQSVTIRVDLWLFMISPPWPLCDKDQSMLEEQETGLEEKDLDIDCIWPMVLTITVTLLCYILDVANWR